MHFLYIYRIITICNMKDIVVFDVETTGLRPQKDYIIQLSAMLLDGETLWVKDTRNWYIEPVGEYDIAQGAFEKHGITKEFLKKNGVKLKDIANEIIEFFGDYNILTYNGNSFDVNFLYCNLLREGVEFNLSNRVFFDAYLMWKKIHPSTLEAVYKYYTGKTLDDAHNSVADVQATIEVFKHLRDQENLTIDIMESAEENQLISPEKSIVSKNMDGENKLFFATGKHKDEEFMHVCNTDPTYIKWFFDNVATLYTKRLLKKYYESHKDDSKD